MLSLTLALALTIAFPFALASAIGVGFVECSGLYFALFSAIQALLGLFTSFFMNSAGLRGSRKLHDGVRYFLGSN